MNPEQLLLQLGLAGAILFVVYKLGMKWLDKWSEGERQRNAALADGFREITTSVNTHSARDVASHEKLTSEFAAHREQTKADHTRLETKLDVALDLTPRPQEIPTRRQTPVHGIGVYSQRAKTEGR